MLKTSIKPTPDIQSKYPHMSLYLKFQRSPKVYPRIPWNSPGRRSQFRSFAWTSCCLAWCIDEFDHPTAKWWSKITINQIVQFSLYIATKQKIIFGGSNELLKCNFSISYLIIMLRKGDCFPNEGVISGNSCSRCYNSILIQFRIEVWISHSYKKRTRLEKKRIFQIWPMTWGNAVPLISLLCIH